jgi:hypothetical protein
MSPDQIAALGAFLSGVGSVLTASWYVRKNKKNADAECDKRIEEFDRALHEGVQIAREHEDHPDH